MKFPAFCLLLVLVPLSVEGQTVFFFQQGENGYQGTRDAHILANKPVWNTGNEPLLEATGNGGLVDAKHTLIRFDLSSIPAGTEIDSAALSLYFAARRTPQQATKKLGIYRLLKAWGEGLGDDPGGLDGRPAVAGEATWQYARHDQQAWGAPGADAAGQDRTASAVDSVAIAPEQPTGTWQVWDVTDLVAFWVAHPDSNFGLLVRETRIAPEGGILDFASSEHSEIHLRPTLFVQSGVVNRTVVRQTVTSPGGRSIRVTLAYLGDDNQDGQATVAYKASGAYVWSTEQPMTKTRGSYTATVDGLAPETAYDLRITLSDPDGVEGANPVIVTDVRTAEGGGFINFAHLEHLTEAIAIDGDSMAIVHIYSRFPEYGRVGDEDEGIAAVDDAARAAVAYLMRYRHTGDAGSLHRAKLLLKFLFHMQADDGGFYNFVWPDLSINKTGSTSNNNSFNFWASRALWAMGYAYNLFVKQDIEAALREELKTRIDRAIARATSLTWNAYNFYTVHGFDVPASFWLLNNGADQSSETALGLAYYYEVTGDAAAEELLIKLCDGLVAFQLGDGLTFPFGAHLAFTPNIFLWHGWGSRQTQALALAGRILNRADWLASARIEANNFYLHLLTSEIFHELRPGPVLFPQINYDVSPIVGGLVELFRATGEERYAHHAGLFASWWLGNNAQNFAMYDSATGRSFDGLEANGINLDSGAESVAEGLMALQMVHYTPEARPYLFYSTVGSHHFQKIEGEDYSAAVAGTPRTVISQGLGNARFSANKYLALDTAEAVVYDFDLEPSAEDVAYVLYLQFIHRKGQPGETALELRIDGGPPMTVAQGGHDSEFLWVRHLSEPITLNGGAHTLEVRSTGTAAERPATLDYIILQPVRQRKVFADVRGDTVVVERTLPLTTDVRDAADGALPTTSVLLPNHPNPFNAGTAITFELAEASQVAVRVYNLLGQRVATLVQGRLTAGQHRVTWDARAAPTGVYILALELPHRTLTRTMLLLR